MDKEKDFEETIEKKKLKKGSDEEYVESDYLPLEEDEVSEEDEIDSTESIEEHYAKMYKDLPPDVVKMLISTHPLYGDKSETPKPKEVVREPIREPIKVKEPVREATKETVKESIAPLVKEKPEPEPVHKTKYEEDLEEDSDEEKDFLYSLFSKKEDGGHSTGFIRYITVGILTTALVVCIIGIGVNIAQNKKNQDVIAKLKTTNQALDIEAKNSKESYKILEDEYQGLQKEKESLEAVIQSGQVPPPQAPEATDDNNATENNATQSTTAQNKQSTYTVTTKDSLWKISTNVYGSGKYAENIARANGLKIDSTLTPGTVLKLPDIQGGQ